MKVEEMKQLKKENGYTYAQMAERSGVPIGTSQKIFSGETVSPRYDTLRALERMFVPSQELRESSAYGLERQQGEYTVEDYEALPEEQRVELIDGYFYDMAAPTTTHQRIGGEIYRQIANFIYDRDGKCIPLISPVDVQLDCDNRTMLQPDVAIVCTDERMTQRCVYGAPDFMLEVISPSSRRKDFTLKLSKYEQAGVREYWILDPYQKVVIVYFFEDPACPMIYGLSGSIPVRIYDGELKIDVDRIARWCE